MSKSIVTTENDLFLPSQQETNLTSFLRTIKRNALPIAGIAGIITAIAWYNSRNYVPIYKGSFEMLVEPISSEAKISEPSTLTGSSKQVNSKLELDYSTLINILKSGGMLSSVVQEIQPQYPQVNLKKLKDDLVVQRLGSSKIDQTKIIRITYQNSDPELTQTVLEETAEKYLDYSLQERKKRIGQGVNFINQQLPELRNRVNNLHTDIQKIQEQNQLIDPQSKGENLLEQIRELKEQQLQVQYELNSLRILEQTLQKQLKVNPERAIAISTVSEDSNYQTLLDEFKVVESEIATQSVLYESNSPVIQRLEEKRQNLLNLLNQERQRILKGDSLTMNDDSPLLNLQNQIFADKAKQLVETTTQIKLLEAQEQSLTQTINQFEQQARKIPQVVSQYTKLTQELNIANRTLQQLLTQKDTLSVELAQSQIPWEIVSQPRLQKDSAGNPAPLPVDSNKKLISTLMGGLLAGIILTTFLEKSLNIFHTATDLEEVIKSPLLGKITWNDAPQKLLYSALPANIQDNDREHIFDSFKSLYNNLRLRYGESAIGSLVVSSASPQDDTSTIAWNLAETAAATGQKVLLVDANLSDLQPTIDSDSSNLMGLSDLLSTQKESCDIVRQSTHNSNLFILSAGRPLSNFSGLITSNRMQQLIAEFDRAFDLVIYDAPPISENMDTSFLATHTNGILMPVAIGKTKQSAVSQALKQIKDFNLKLLGVISTQIS